MRFHPNYPTDNNKGQRHLWHALKSAFERDEGVAYYRYPIFATSGRGRSEPDFLLIHRQYGIWVLESKGCQIGNIAAIEGHDWQMRAWYSESMSPICQVEAHMFEVRTLVERDPVLRSLKVPFEYRVVLPFITASDWTRQGYGRHPSTNGVVWLEEDIVAPRLRRHLHDASARYMPALDDRAWEQLLGAFRGEVAEQPARRPIPGSPPSSFSRTIHAVESHLKLLDEKQDRVAQEVPDGPQRLRGLAGTGKTVLFARRVAQMHASHPEWDIAFVYWSRSLNQQIRDLVESNFRRLTGDRPDWDRLHVLHAWGSRDKPGLYRKLSRMWNCRPLSLDEARQASLPGESPFEAACRELEKHCADQRPVLDAVIIDEGQDLPSSFYRVVHHALREPKRLYWAYDEAQGVDTLMVPRAAEIFGRTADGRPNVDLSGTYASGMLKAHNINRCYRTPRQILTAAHAINMGLLRKGGPLQGVTSKEDWEALGYRVTQGDFGPSSVKSGAIVVVERPDTSSGHPIDHPDFGSEFDRSSVFVIKITQDEQQDVDVVVKGIQRDLEGGLRPEDIAVVCLERTGVLLRIHDELRTLGIRTLPLNDGNRDGFRHEGHVTLSSVRRAKGNEAYKVYAMNLHLADASEVRDLDRELVARNQVFVALTRTKLWCVAIGRDVPLMQELKAAADQRGALAFRAFNQASLRRAVGDTEGRQMDLI